MSCSLREARWSFTKAIRGIRCISCAPRFCGWSENGIRGTFLIAPVCTSYFPNSGSFESMPFSMILFSPRLPRRLIWFLRNLSILLENAPVVRRLAGSILIHAQKPPRGKELRKVSLFEHESLRGAISVVIPSHNEEMNIGPLVERILASLWRIHSRNNSG